MLILPLLEFIEIPSDPEKRISLLGLADKPTTKKQFLALLQDVLLLPYGITSETTDVPAGLSSYSFKRLFISNNWKAEELERMKVSICRFLCGGIFPDQDILSLLVLASSDTRFSVATPAIAELSKVCTSIDWTDHEITAPYVKFLYAIIGTNRQIKTNSVYFSKVVHSVSGQQHKKSRAKNIGM